MSDKGLLTKLIKEKAIDLGFSGIAVAKAEHMDEEARLLEQWLNKGLHGNMFYMTEHFDKRTDPTKLIPGAKTVICLMYNYFTEEKQTDPESPKLSMYAYGKDYHKVVYKKMKKLFSYINKIAGDVNGRTFVDSAPVMERDWAKRAGLGWIGKNSLLINPKKGSFFFLGEIICDLILDYDMPMQDYCGTCTRCIEACPTEAISPQGYLVDSNKCISYLTIELKEDIPIEFKDKMDNYMYGCDICQQVCPWNKFSEKHTEPTFNPSLELMNMSKKEWHQLNEETFDRLFFSSPVKRAMFKGLKRNINFLK
jgi:epoxyqueuosine reductase